MLIIFFQNGLPPRSVIFRSEWALFRIVRGIFCVSVTKYVERCPNLDRKEHLCFVRKTTKMVMLEKVFKTNGIAYTSSVKSRYLKWDIDYTIIILQNGADGNKKDGELEKIERFQTEILQKKC